MIIVQEQPETKIYMPSVSERMLRVIYRLEHGEKLIAGRLYNGENFCATGMLADESDLGQWCGADMFYYGDAVTGAAISYTDIMSYYQLKRRVYIELLPKSVADFITGLYESTITLPMLNDKLVHHDDCSELIANILRSGVFNRC